MGDWIFYVTSLCFDDVARLVKPSKELVKSEALRDFIQRRLTGRSKAIARYLLTDDQRMFNSLVLAVYGGDPEWLEIELSQYKFSDDPLYDEETLVPLEGVFGILQFSGEEKVFAIDGQHRAKGIAQAVKERESLGAEYVPVVFVGHTATAEGQIRSRRLFTTLNKYAKPVNTYDRIALDEDDVAAILTRQLVEEHPSLLGKRVSKAESASIPTTDLTSLTMLRTIYDINVLRIKNLSISGVKWSPSRIARPRPSDEILHELYETVKTYWDWLPVLSPDFKVAVETQDEDRPGLQIRPTTGGDMTFRPVGQLALAGAERFLLDEGKSVADARAALAGCTRTLDSDFWSGVLWNKASSTMIASTLSRKVATGLLVRQAGGTVELSKLTDDYRKLLGNPNANLP